MKRRQFLQTSLAATFAPTILTACSGEKTPISNTGYFDPGIYLADNFGPVARETTVMDLQVIGEIPRELTGNYLRNGPNPRGNVNADDYHWFTGDGMVHGVRLENGKAAWYRNRFTAVGDGFSPNTNVIGHAGNTYAIVESGSPPVMLGDQLDPVAAADWGGYTAHPKIDPVTGELHAIAYDWAELRDHVQYKVIGTDGKLKKTVDIPLAGMPMIHDMSLTENYVVIYDLPVTLSFMALGTGATFPFRWDNDHPARVGLMPRDGSPADIIWASVSQNYSYHPMNAHEDAEGRVVIDICRYERMFEADTHGPFGDSLPRLDRWTINPTNARASEETIDETPQEFPRCHPALNARAYRYGYTLAVGERAFPALYKHDLQTGSRDSFEFGGGRHGAEAIFVPREGSTAEDDGYLMNFVFDEARNASELLILDAADLARGALAQVLLPTRVPYGFHGNWLADA